LLCFWETHSPDGVIRPASLNGLDFFVRPKVIPPNYSFKRTNQSLRD